MTPGERLVLVLAGALAVLFLVETCQPDPAPTRGEQLAVQLEATRPAFDSARARDSIAAAASAAEQRRLEQLERRARAEADAQRRRADSLAAIEDWYPAYIARTLETAELWRELRLKDARIDSLIADTTRKARVLGEAQVRLDRAELVVIPQLRRDIVAAGRCRFLGIPCPTRKQSAIGGALLGIVAATR